jgi:hypothetical protein
MHGILTGLGIGLMIALVGYGIYWQHVRSRSLVRTWAERSGLELLSCEMRFFRRGPFFWTSSKGQTIFFVKVQDGQNRVRYGWVRCGGWWLGLFSDKTEVRWQDGSE